MSHSTSMVTALCVAGAVCRHSTLYLVATSNKHRVKSRHEHLVLESLKLMDKALRHKPGSPAGALVAATVDPVDVVRGLTAAVSLKMTKVRNLPCMHCFSPSLDPLRYQRTDKAPD